MDWLFTFHLSQDPSLDKEIDDDRREKSDQTVTSWTTMTTFRPNAWGESSNDGGESADAFNELENPSAEGKIPAPTGEEIPADDADEFGGERGQESNDDMQYLELQDHERNLSPQGINADDDVHPLSEKIEVESAVDENDTVEQILRNHSPVHSIRMALTYLLLLLVPACAMTLIAVPNYHLLLGTFWLFLFALFGSFVWFIQHDVIHRRALHPYIHAMYDTVVREYTDFMGDWRQQLLLLTYDETFHEAGTKECAEGPSRHKIRSKVFKVVVKPFLPFLRRRRRKSRKDGEVAPEAEGYKAAPDGSVMV
jgi:hypothetical protein